MKKDNLSIVISIIVTLLIFATIIIVLNFNKNKNLPKDNDNLKNKTLLVLKDDDRFFNVQNIVNIYYESLVDNKLDNLFSMLDSNYIEANNITKDNLLNVLSDIQGDTTFTAKKIFYVNKNNRYYYYVNGYIIEQTMTNNLANYTKDINFLVTIDHNLYSIYPLKDNNYEIFSNNFNYSESALFSKYNKINIDTSKKLSIYLASFLYLLDVSPKDAYDYLNSDAKNKYKNVNELKEAAQKLSSIVFSYEYNDYNSYYSVLDNNLNEITIKENNTMDYKISF